METRLNKNILYCGYGIVSNIGNGFIDLGVEYSLKKAAPLYNIISSSNSQSEFKRRFGWRYNFTRLAHVSDFDTRAVIDADILVFAGALFNRLFIFENKVLIKHLTETRKKVIIYGGGGGEKYTDEEFSFIKETFRKINIIGFISRDEISFEHFKNLSPSSFNGVDCSFFLSDCFVPAKFTGEKFIIYTFDDIKEPKSLDHSGRKIIRLHHSPNRLGSVENFVKHPYRTYSLMFKNDFMSDYPGDYLHLYANCEAVYTDRVHACAATLIYGNSAQYFGKSPRSFLFERIGVTDLKNRLVQFNVNNIADIKTRQIEFLSEIINRE